MGLLETRVSVGNVARVQRGLLPRWNWFVDYTGPGNRIWLSWDDDLIGVDVLDISDQFVHCDVYIRCIHVHILITIVYDVNDMVGRRLLWADLGRISHMICDVPWLVGGISILYWMIVRDSRNLWKRLDRLLVNDCWLGAWPNTSYVSLNARTSDHSPLVLRGDVAGQTSTETEKRGPVFQCEIGGYLSGFSTGSPNTGQTVSSFTTPGICCKMILRLATRLEQNMLHQRAKIAWMKGGDQCSRVSFRKVAKRRSSKRVFQITDSGGQVLTEQQDVVREFIAFYQNLLGGERRNRMLDLCYLRPWARHILSEAEALTLVQPVTPSEIKHAVFDIDEVKAPGLDGYSSGFFKAAWPVIGEEVTRAILEFLRTGRLLKQVNTTLISLVPKVHNPTVVSEFRSISCCNVLYKIITKVIVQRMRGVLDKLISPSQNAFVPGRSIGDNILLAQELFHGYNQQHLPPRCALKLDLRKAYDTVEWDFLSAVLMLFGFPVQFISWIEECVMTPSFSVWMNGSPHDFFRGARGLRQGDPMSPFMFVLVMEVLTLILQQFIDQDGGFSYHWRCGEVQLFQFEFADDLLLFSRADTSSIQIFKRGLTVFADLSGLHVNPQKSHLILSCSDSAHRDILLPILGYQEGHLPLRYLGLPLLASRLTIADCKPILQKIDDRIKGWEGIMLSFAGRVQLIKSVHIALQGGTGGGYAKVSWQQVCRPVSEGGLGIRDILALNRGLMSRYLWRVIVADRSSIWVDWIIHYRLRGSSIWTTSDRSGPW
ncbi:UNVERIFIED_CONTAM: LINE-1 retrotransposable element O protein, partial [Sesamum latifolium]